MSGSKRELLLLLAPILQLQARLSFSFLLLPLLLLLPIVIEFCVCRQSGKQAKSSRAEAAAKRKQFQAKFSLNASATRWRRRRLLPRPRLTDCRAAPCATCYMAESSRESSRATCWLFAVAYCPFGCWLKLCLLWNSINLNLLHWRDVISFFFPLPHTLTACLPAPNPFSVFVFESWLMIVFYGN